MHKSSFIKNKMKTRICNCGGVVYSRTIKMVNGKNEVIKKEKFKYCSMNMLCTNIEMSK